MSERAEASKGHFLRDIGIFRGLTDDQLDSLAAIGHRQVLPAGEILVRGGAPAERLYAILRGTVGRLTVVEEAEVTVGTIGPGSAIPLRTLTQLFVAITTLKAATEVEAFVFPRARLLELLDQEPAMGNHVRQAALSELAGRYQESLDRLTACVHEAGEERQMRAQVELGAAREQLLQSGRLAALGELIATVAHEVNNPLTGVLGFAQLLLRRELAEDVRRDVEVIHDEAQRAARVVQNLVSFARKHKQEKSLMSINEALENTLVLREYEMRVNNLKVVRELQPDLPQTVADFHEMQQVFLNVIINAEQAMSEAHGQGTLVVKTRQVRERIQIIFADDGPGIAAENLDRIFSPFFTTKGANKGTGLGLGLCQGIVRDHGGTIRVESEEGRGTTFIVEIPVVTKQNNVELSSRHAVSGD